MLPPSSVAETRCPHISETFVALPVSSVSIFSLQGDIAFPSILSTSTACGIDGLLLGFAQSHSPGTFHTTYMDYSVPDLYIVLCSGYLSK